MHYLFNLVPNCKGENISERKEREGQQEAFMSELLVIMMMPDRTHMIEPS